MNALAISESLALPEGEMPDEFEISIDDLSLMTSPMWRMRDFQTVWDWMVSELNRRGYEVIQYRENYSMKHVMKCRKRTISGLLADY